MEKTVGYTMSLFLSLNLHSLPARARTVDQRSSQLAQGKFMDPVRRAALNTLIDQLSRLNPDADPDFFQTFSQRQIYDGLMKCHYESSEMDFMDQLISIFSEALTHGQGSKEIIAKLKELPALKDSPDLQSLVRGAFFAPEMTLNALKNQNCRTYLNLQFQNGATQQQLRAVTNNQMLN